MTSIDEQSTDIAGGVNKAYETRSNNADTSTLETENIGATARLEINGKLVSVFTYSHFRADITDYIVNGGNHIKITVSNTLCNHYSTIPSKYSNYPFLNI